MATRVDVGTLFVAFAVVSEAVLVRALFGENVTLDRAVPRRPGI